MSFAFSIEMIKRKMNGNSFQFSFKKVMRIRINKIIIITNKATN